MSPDFVRACLMARLSAAAYLTDLNALSLACANAGLEYVALVTWPGFQALIAREPGKSNVIVFRGTPVTCGRGDRLSDRLNDAIEALEIDAGLSHVNAPGGGKILAGVWRALMRYWPQIEAHIDLNLPIVFTGHSLGAVFALAAPEMLSEIFGIEVWAFAPFQFADAAFHERVYAPARRARFVWGAENDFAPGHDHADPVTTLSGPIFHLLADGGVETVTTWPIYRESIADHAVENYVALIEKMAGRQDAPAQVPA